MNARDTRRIRPAQASHTLLFLIIGLVAATLLAQCGQGGRVQAGDKEEFTLQVALGYAADHDLEKAQEQLTRLDVPNVKQWVLYLVDQYITEGRDPTSIDALTELALGLEVESPKMLAYLATPTPLPTDTPTPTATPTSTSTPSPTPTPLPTDTPIPPTDTPTPSPTDTPSPTATRVPPTKTPRPRATNTPKPPPTATPKPAPAWTWTAWLVGPGQDSQTCGGGNLQIRVMVQEANGAQIPGIWIYDRYSQQYQVTGNVNSPDWGPGETKFEYGRHGGGSLCVAEGQGGRCISDFTRDMPCFENVPLDDLYNAGYCNCCEQGASKERCQELINQGKCVALVFGHFSWRVVFRRGW